MRALQQRRNMFRVLSKRNLAIMLAFAGAAISAAQNNPLGMPVDITLWGGISTRDGAGIPRDSKTGLRFAEVAFMPNANWRYWAKYDNSLTLDNFTFLNNGDTGEAYYLGGQYHAPKQFQVLLEAGIRHLENDIDQTIIRGEYVMFNPGDTHLKLGLWVGPREDDKTEWMTYAGYNFPITDRFRAEPTFFYARSGFNDEEQWRILLGGDYNVNDSLKINGGIAFGRQKGFLGSSDFVGGHVLFEMPLTSNNKAYILIKREHANDQNLWNFAMGVTISLR